jgi:hypothetical protein
MRNEALKAIITRKEIDFVFGLRRPDWEKKAKSVFAVGWVFRTGVHDYGSPVAGFDPATGKGFSIRPLFMNDTEPPAVVIIDSYFPLGALPAMTEETKHRMEATAQKDLGTIYTVQLAHSKRDQLEMIHLIVTKA